MNVLFICRANVGRSQIAEAIFTRLYPASTAISAGTQVDHPSETLQTYAERNFGHSFVIPAMRELGFNIGDARRTALDPLHAEGIDCIISMAEPLTEPSWLISHPRFTHWDVRDPAGASIQSVRDAREEIYSLLIENFGQVAA